MRIRSTVIICIIAFGLAGMAALAAVGMLRIVPFAGLSDSTVMLQEVRSYKSWTNVNPERQPMATAVALLCGPPLPSHRVRFSLGSPHDTACISVYVNGIGRTAMMSQATPRFPTGSIIVKEKFPDLQSHKLEMLTVMVKREPGYDSTRGDWEYLVVDGDLAEIKARGAIQSCQGCHIEQASNDYIFRTYLPPDVTQALN